MPSKKKSKSKTQHKSIVTPKVSGKKLVDDKNTEPISLVDSPDLVIDTEITRQVDVEVGVKENVATVIDHSGDAEISKEEIVISPDAVAAEEEHTVTSSSEGSESNVDIDKFPVETDNSKKNKRKKKPSKSEVVKLVGTSYHYFRGWLKNHLSEAGIKGFRFIKDDVGWQGYISIPSDSFEAAMKALQEFKNNQPEGTKDLFW